MRKWPRRNTYKRACRRASAKERNADRYQARQDSNEEFFGAYNANWAARVTNVLVHAMTMPRGASGQQEVQP